MSDHELAALCATILCAANERLGNEAAVARASAILNEARRACTPAAPGADEAAPAGPKKGKPK